MEQEKTVRRNSRVKLYITVFTFILFVVLIYALRDQIGNVISNLGKINLWALLLMIPIEALNYDSYARLYKRLFKMLGDKVDYWPMYRVMLELNFVNHILPSGGVSGISYFSVRLKSENISTTKSTFVQVLKFLFLYISFLPILVVALFALALRGHTSNFIILIFSSIITAIIIGTFAGVYIIESRSRVNGFLTWITKAINWLVHLFMPNHPQIIKIESAQLAFSELHDNYQLIKKNWKELRMPLFYTAIADLTEVAAVYVVYIAFGKFVNFGAVVLAYAVANLAGLISVLPAGIGVYEALMTAILAATGIPASLSIPVTLMYRVVSMFIQLTPGYVLYQKAVKDGLTTKI
jgi:putative heme transporter